jgi:hypothetical protein
MFFLIYIGFIFLINLYNINHSYSINYVLIEYNFIYILFLILALI